MPHSNVLTNLNETFGIKRQAFKLCQTPLTIGARSMQSDQEKWDARYRENPGGSEPSPIMAKYWNLASIGNALDIACGNGRNSLFLASKGFAVDAVDISTVATDHLAGSDPKLHVICADLDHWRIPPDHYTLILNVRFLDRRLFPMIREGLQPGGVLIFESFMNGENDAYCLKRNELLRAFLSLRVIYYEERKTRALGKFDQVASLVAVKQ
jgi:tellurite methyltransferase